jgi:uncharacterized membrane protein YqjE
MTPQPGHGLAHSLRRLAGTLLAILQTRVELLATEVEEEKLRLGEMAGYAVAAFFFLGFGVVLLALLLTVLLWDSHRLLALGVATALFLGAGGVSAFVVVRRAQAGSKLFAASLAELARDREALSDEQ